MQSLSKPYFTWLLHLVDEIILSNKVWTVVWAISTCFINVIQKKPKMFAKLQLNSQAFIFHNVESLFSFLNFEIQTTDYWIHKGINWFFFFFFFQKNNCKNQDFEPLPSKFTNSANKNWITRFWILPCENHSWLKRRWQERSSWRIFTPSEWVASINVEVVGVGGRHNPIIGAANYS